MTVKQLSEILAQADPDAPVRIWQGVDAQEDDVFLEIADGVADHQRTSVTLKLQD